MIIIGYLLALLMGLSLGLIGAGGSIITLPLLVYIFHIPPSQATVSSLVMVGITAAFGALRYGLKGLIHVKAVAAFAIPSLLSVTVTRLFIVPRLPHYIGEVAVDKLILLLFSLLMMIIALVMLKPSALKKTQPKLYWLVFMSLGVGFITGLLGAGGGFLIIPVLTLFFGLEMNKAIATSLAIITLNSLFGVSSTLATGFTLNWALLLPLLVITLTGMAAGLWLAPRFNNAKLKILFATLTLLLGISILIKELIVILGFFQ